MGTKGGDFLLSAVQGKMELVEELNSNNWPIQPRMRAQYKARRQALHNESKQDFNRIRYLNRFVSPSKFPHLSTSNSTRFVKSQWLRLVHIFHSIVSPTHVLWRLSYGKANPLQCHLFHTRDLPEGESVMDS
jgi:hypothetical protein